MKIVTVIGARPQFIKARPLSALLRLAHDEILVHTGQHYDADMSEAFFRDLGIDTPDYYLDVRPDTAGGSGHGAMTGAMLRELERVLLKEKPDLVLVFGDTNSTLAGALAAAKLHIPVAHVEAGLRSFNRAMPEEINRILTDHISTVLFVPSESAREQLLSEGITDRVHVVGDIMYDAVKLFSARAAESSFLSDLGLSGRDFYLCTLHRAENVDHRDRLTTVMATLGRLKFPVLFPRHPRTAKMMAEFGIEAPANLIITKPAGYLEMLQAQMHAKCVLTDSGGVQKEAYYCGVPCVTLREETEWTELVTAGWNIVAGVEAEPVLDAVRKLQSPPPDRPDLYGSGNTAELILKHLDLP